MGMLTEFQKFALRGNVVDMAVGVVMGGAFGKIVSSLVNDIVMPPLGLLTGGEFSGFTYTLREAQGDAEAVTIKLGAFINTVVDFVIISFVIFIVVRQMNKVMEQIGPKKETPAPTTKTCGYCCSSIPLKASRCPYCTSQLADT